MPASITSTWPRATATAARCRPGCRSRPRCRWTGRRLEPPGLIERSLNASLERLRLPRADLLLTHCWLLPDGEEGAGRSGLPFRDYVQEVRPALERLVADAIAAERDGPLDAAETLVLRDACRHHDGGEVTSE